MHTPITRCGFWRELLSLFSSALTHHSVRHVIRLVLPAFSLDHSIRVSHQHIIFNSIRGQRFWQECHKLVSRLPQAPLQLFFCLVCCSASYLFVPSWFPALLSASVLPVPFFDLPDAEASCATALMSPVDHLCTLVWSCSLFYIYVYSHFHYDPILSWHTLMFLYYSFSEWISVTHLKWNANNCIWYSHKITIFEGVTWDGQLLWKEWVYCSYRG